MKTKIRKIEIEDYEGIHHLWMNTPGMGLNTADDSRLGIEKFLRRNPETCFLAEENNEIIGVILSGHDGRRAYIYHLAVKTEYRRRGLGRALVEQALNALKREGLNKVALVVFNKNSSGNLFWQKMGFEKRDDLVYRNKEISERKLERIDVL